MDYDCFAVKAQGYNHILKNLVCQDSVKCFRDESFNIIAVADGHGSAQYFRSEKGADFAVSCAILKLTEFVKEVSVKELMKKKNIEYRVKQLAKSIVTEWHLAVRNDFLKDPFKIVELDKVPNKYLDDYTKGIHVEKAYGTTLIAVAECESYGVGLQIGDGRCIALYENGIMTEDIPWDDNCHLNQCTSICDADAVDEFRFHVWIGNHPIAFMICSDGVDDSYGVFLHDYFRSVFLELTNGDFNKKVQELGEKLPAISKNGSKDDVSIAGLVNTRKVEKIRSLLEYDIQIANIDKEIVSAQNRQNDLKYIFSKAERAYNKTLMLSVESEKNDKLDKYNEVKKELDEITDIIDNYKSERENLLELRRTHLDVENSVVICPECGHEINLK